MRNLFVTFLLALGIAYPQSAVTLNGTTYSMTGHPRTLIDGPGGVIDSRIKDPDGAGPLTAPKAVATNPAWVALGSAVSAALPGYQLPASRYGERGGSTAMEFATYWYGDNSQTAAYNAALYMLNNIEQFVPLLCVESQTDCGNGGSGYGITSFGIAYWAPNWIMAYELMRGQMTPAQRQTFADKMLNDNAAWGGIGGSPAASCANPTAAAGSVVITQPQFSASNGTLIALTVTYNVVATATIGSSTAGMQAGDSVSITGGSLGATTFQVLSINGPNSFSFGYTPSNPNGNALTPGTVITYNSLLSATASGPVFGSTINLGDWILTPTNGYNLGVVANVISPTVAYLTAPIGATNGSDTLYYRPKAWSPGQCGFLWHVKHDEWTPQVLTYSNGATLYPPDGGVNGADLGHNLVYSALWGVHMVLLSVMDDDANAPMRGGAELTTAYNWWYAGPNRLAQQLWTGFHQSGSGYGIERASQFMPGTAMAVQNSLINPPNLLGGVWAQNVMSLHYANAFPNSQANQMQWGQPDVSGAEMTAANLDGFVMLAYWFRNTVQGQYANWWLQNLWAVSNTGFGNPPGTNLGFTAANINNAAAWFYIFTDQSYPVSSLSGAPTTFAWNSSATGSAGQRADALISRTGYLSATDTLLNFHAETIPEFDHNVFANQPSNYGSYKIYKGNYLLAEDYGIDFSNPSVNGFTSGGTASNYVEVGRTVNNVIVGPTPVSSAIPRATGTNSFAYAMADVTQSYVPSVGLQRGYRHLIDFKKPYTQQFMVDYMDFLTAGGQTKKAYYHYPNMRTTSLSGGVVTSNNSSGNASQLLTQVLAPQAVVIAQNTSGSSFRLDICPTLDGSTCDATNTQAEMMVVHMPFAGTGGALPPVSLMSAVDPNFRGVEIDGASPKIAILPRNGATYASASFTAGHGGTAQILISGITPTATSGITYTLSQNGNAVLQNQTVGPDGTLYYEGTAGEYEVAVTITAAPTPPVAPPDPLPPAPVVPTDPFAPAPASRPVRVPVPHE